MPAPSRREMLAGVIGAAALGGGLLEVRGSEAGRDRTGSRVEVVVPAAAGGGFDTVARQAQHALRENGLARTVEVLNLPGGGGTVGLSHVAQQAGRADLLMVMGTSILGGIRITGSATTLADITPLAKLAEDYVVVAVRADSPIGSMAELARRWRARPRETAVAGGAVGTADHLLAAMALHGLGADPADLNYIVYSGDGEVLTALLSHTADVAVSSLNGFAAQIEAGQVRALAVSSAERLPGVDIPTVREGGIDLDLANWRGLAAPPGLDRRARRRLDALVADLVETPQWRSALQRFGWRDALLTGADFTDFLAEEDRRLTGIIEGLGLS
ncbi:tripartite tricarboxylate transporter substrate binding protein [Streptomonospora sp. S1-112]|uniref:Tripartite tricarboxylate transporter substrate binding protein n=1 Tax=Streptomonospora mangrovi TaxID=2883123 RepID=A0A9X3NLX4_9ACTN|nr:tripartite tricarboxylate transporter substrate binding protein [Streptomonospora mangrovi]MDA0564451.1 tripartite tricarboxylate transporter substrate binding protein [Streptomonospora mangrovi]